MLRTDGRSTVADCIRRLSPRDFRNSPRTSLFLNRNFFFPPWCSANALALLNICPNLGIAAAAGVRSRTPTSIFSADFNTPRCLSLPSQLASPTADLPQGVGAPQLTEQHRDKLGPTAETPGRVARPCAHGHAVRIRRAGKVLTIAKRCCRIVSWLSLQVVFGSLAGSKNPTYPRLGQLRTFSSPSSQTRR